MRWIERERKLDKSKKIILFGAGAYGKKALNYFGEDNVICYTDNSTEIVGSMVNGKEVISLNKLKEIWREYQIVISVDGRKTIDLAKQLEENGISDYAIYLEYYNNNLNDSIDSVKGKK